MAGLRLNVMLKIPKNEYDALSAIKTELGLTSVQDVVRVAIKRFTTDYEKGIVLKRPGPEVVTNG